ncbi:IS110 family transposase [Vibrio vulnificus]
MTTTLKNAGCVSINVGIDVSKESLDVCLLSDQTKSGQRYRKFKNDKGAHSDLSSWLLKTAKCKAEDILITMESTGIYHESIAFYLHMAVFFWCLYLTPAKQKSSLNHWGLYIRPINRINICWLCMASRAHLWTPDSLNVRNIKSLSRRLSA